MDMFNFKKPSKTSDIVSSLGYWSLLLLATVLPLFVLTTSNVPSLMVKVFVGGSLVFVALLFFAVTHIRAQEIQVPKSLILATAWLVPLAYLLSSLFSSGGQPLFGEQLNMDSTVFMIITAIALTISAITLNTPKKALGLYLAMLGAVSLLTIAEIYIFFFRGTVESLGLQSVSLVGSLNDLAVFFGLIAIFALLSLILLPVTNVIRGVLWGVLVASAFFLMVVNLTVLWWIFGAFALSFLIYSISTTYFSRSGGKLDQISIASLVMFVLSVIFIFGGSFTTKMAEWADVGEFDVRPSWQTTVSIGDQALSDTSVIFGTGPGTFANVWSRYMPSSINVTAFWLTPFPYGIGLVPTSVITTGLLGALAWFTFFVVFLWRGSRNMLLSTDSSQGSIADYIRVTSFVAALYLWINTIIQVPSPVLVIYAALLTGVFIASLNFGASSSKYFSFAFRDNPRVGFAITLVLTLATLGSVGGIYGLTTRYKAEAYFQQAARLVSEEGKIDDAFVLTTKAIESNRADIYYRFISNLDMVRIQNLVAQNKPPEEIKEEYQELLTRAIKNAMEATILDELDYQNWVNLGNIYQSNIPYGVDGVMDSAIGAYDQALTLHPNSPSIYYAKAVLEHARGDNVKAREYVQNAITMRNQYTDAIFLLAQIQIENNEVADAIKSVEAITLFNPLNAVAFFQLGLLHYAAEEFPRSIEAFGRAVEINPDYANARYFLGLSYWRLGNNANALEEFRKVQATNPDNAEVVSVIANLEAGKEPFAQAATSTAADIQGRAGLPITGAGESAILDPGVGNLTQ
jgi:tetratricopeptide (TPR) repeat protein